MATLYVKDVPDSLYRALKDRADRNGRSISAEVRQILEMTVPPRRSRSEVVAAIEKLQEKIARDVKGRWIDVTASIREDRDSR
jgi:plasmid stability protein